jgi:hypothetical protein
MVAVVEVGLAGFVFEVEAERDGGEGFEAGGLGRALGDGAGGDADDGQAVLAEDGGDVHDLGGLAAGGDADDGVGLAEAAEVAVGGFGGMHAVTGDAQRREGGADLGADEPGLA